MDPTLNSIRHSFLDAVKEMDPVDAVVLQYLYKAKMTVVRVGRAQEPINNQTTGIENIALAIGRRNDEVEMSLRHLKHLLFFDELELGNTSWSINAISREFSRACYPEISPK
jgi:hypothetical protein